MFTVEWLDSAVNELTVIWNQADSALRKAITAASNEIDQRLQSNPHNEGESRAYDTRFVFITPLTVLFRVELDGKTVTVVQVRLYRRKKT